MPVARSIQRATTFTPCIGWARKPLLVKYTLPVILAVVLANNIFPGKLPIFELVTGYKRESALMSSTFGWSGKAVQGAGRAMQVGSIACIRGKPKSSSVVGVGTPFTTF